MYDNRKSGNDTFDLKGKKKARGTFDSLPERKEYTTSDWEQNLIKLDFYPQIDSLNK